jgi:hypothetical protein
MRPPYTGPPERERPRVTPITRGPSKSQLAAPTFSDSTVPPRQCGRYDEAWREGFRRGAIDALRLAARLVDDPHTWMVLSELNEWYEDRNQWWRETAE